MANETTPAPSQGSTDTTASQGAAGAPADVKADAGAGAKPQAKGEAKGSVFAREAGEPKADAKADATGEAPKAVELELPEGFDAKAGETLKSLAGKLGLDKAKGGELVKAYVEAQGAAQKAYEEKFQAQLETWKTAAKADPVVKELGGFEKVMRGADRLVTRFDPDGTFADLLERSGMAFEPSVVRFFGRVASALREDTISGTPSAAAGPSPEDVLARLYPNSQSLFSRKE